MLWSVRNFSTCSQCHPLFIRIHALIFFCSRELLKFFFTQSLPFHEMSERDFYSSWIFLNILNFFTYTVSNQFQFHSDYSTDICFLTSFTDFPFLFHSKWSEGKNFSENVFFMGWHGIFLLLMWRFCKEWIMLRWKWIVNYLNRRA